MLVSCDHDVSKVLPEEGDGPNDTSGKVDLRKEREQLSPNMVRKKGNQMEVNKYSSPGSERFAGEGNGNPLQYSCLENSTDRGA